MLATGSIDNVSQDGVISGWACSYGEDDPISVDLYTDGLTLPGPKLARVTADQSSEPSIAQACEANGNAFRFSYTIPNNQRAAYVGKSIYAFTAGNNAPTILNNARRFQVPPPGAPSAPQADIAYKAINDGVELSCDYFNPDAIKSLSTQTIQWLASIQPSGITLHENYLVARQEGYTGPLGQGQHSAWLNADPSRQTDFQNAITTYANAPIPPWNTRIAHHNDRRAAGYQGLFLCGGDVCFQAGQCDALGRRL